MNFLKIGFIKKLHGLKGELSILPLTDNTKRFKELSIIYFLIDGSYLKEEIEFVRITRNDVIVKLKNYSKLEDVQKFKNLYIFIDKSAGVLLKEDEYYTQDLIDCSLRYKDKIIGKIINIQNYGSCDNFIVRYKDKDIIFPFLKKYIEKIDLKNKIIEISQFEGFFD